MVFILLTLATSLAIISFIASIATTGGQESLVAAIRVFALAAALWYVVEGYSHVAI